MPLWAIRAGQGVLSWRSLTLATILLISFVLRVSDLDWDNGHMFHPDERHIFMVTEGIRLPSPIDVGVLLQPESPLNPRSFAYGSLIFYLLKLAQTAVFTVGGLLGISASEGWFGPGYSSMRLVGRTLSALFDTATVYLTFKLGLVLYGRRVGLLAAALVGFSVLHIQLSHFYASDTPMTFFVTLTLLASAHFVRWGQTRHALGAAVAAGMALACKVSAAPILGAVAAAHALRALVPTDEDAAEGVPRQIRLATPDALNRAVGFFAAGMAVTVVTFLILQPYALIDARTFVQNVVEQNNMVRGVADLPYTRQYIDRAAYWYFIQNLALFGVGLPLGVAMVVGWIYVAIRAIREPNRADLLLLAFVLPYFAITGSFHAKFIRYLLPITPVLAIFAAVGLVRLREWAIARQLEWRLSLPKVAAAVTAFVVAATFLYAVAYQNVYRGEHTADEASRWIYENVPRGATLATEHWEEGMPVAVRVAGPERRQLDPGQLSLRQMPLNLYEPDDERKLQHMVSTLAQTDYIVFFSNRLYGTIPRLPERYPMTTRYYQLLFGEQLGFELAGAFPRYPQLLGVALKDDTLADPKLPTPRLLEESASAPLTINLGRADEAFSVYDHPQVLVFKKVRPLTEAEARAVLAPALAELRPGAERGPETYRSLELTPEARLANEAGGTFAELFNRHGLVNQVPLLIWVLVMALIGVAAAPLALAAFPRLSDGGLPLARTIGLLAMTWVTWMLVAALGVPAGWGATFVGFVALGALGALFGRRAWGTLACLWRERPAALIAGELAFWVPFAYFTLVRLSNPDLWHPARGGEKPMDLAYLMAAVKSTTYPPYDPWFAGGFLNYYYYGQLISANLIKLTGVIPTTAYNLMVPTLFALTFAGAFSVAYNLARRGGLVGERPAIIGGIAAALFTTTFGNLGGFGQLVEGLSRQAETSYQSLLPGLQYPILAVAGLWNMVVHGRSLHIPTDWYWGSTRVIEGTINEFPYFTFLYADLHAHMIALPFTLLAMALAANLALSRPPPGNGALPIGVGIDARLRFAAPAVLPRALPALPEILAVSRSAISTAPEEAWRLVVVGLTVGALLPINSWDFPTYLGLVSVAALIPWYLAPSRDLAGLILSVARVATVALLSYVLYLPFHGTFVSFYGGVKPTPQHSELGPYLAIHGFFLFVLVSYLVLDIAGWARASGLGRMTGMLARRWDRFPHLLALRRRLVKRDDGSTLIATYGGLALLGAVTLAAFLTYSVAGFLLALLIPTVWRMLSRPRSAETTFVLLLFATGLALGITCEIVAIDGDVGRMNTVFKFYLQVWAMWAVATAVALTAMRDQLQLIERPGAGRWWAIVVVMLMLATAVYPIVATRARVADRFDTTIPMTLDGTAYMQAATYREDHPQTAQPTNLRLGSDLRAIEWIWDNISGSPVIAEANTPLYRWGSRISIYTGLPTIIGWDWHQTQQRWGFRYMIEERMRDIRTLYADPEPARARDIIRRYNVSYVYVGDVERAYYPAEGLRKLEQMVGTDLEVVYDEDGVRLYRVIGAQR